MLSHRIFALTLLIASPLALADGLEMKLNNNAFGFNYTTDAGGLTQGNSNLHIGGLYNDSMNTLGDIGMLVQGDQGDSAGPSLAVGGKALIGMIKNYIPGTTQNVDAIVIGGSFNYKLPAINQISLGLDYFAGPKITTFGDANRANQWSLHLDDEVSEGTKVFVEYRETNFGITSTGRTATLENGTYMGVRLAF